MGRGRDPQPRHRDPRGPGAEPEHPGLPGQVGRAAVRTGLSKSAIRARRDRRLWILSPPDGQEGTRRAARHRRATAAARPEPRRCSPPTRPASSSSPTTRRPRCSPAPPTSSSAPRSSTSSPLGPGEDAGAAVGARRRHVARRPDLLRAGRRRPVLAAATVTPISDADGTVVGAIVALEDMTEIRRTAGRGDGERGAPAARARRRRARHLALERPRRDQRLGRPDAPDLRAGARGTSTAPGTRGSPASTPTTGRRPSRSSSRRWRSAPTTCSATGSCAPTAALAGSRRTARCWSPLTAARPAPSAASRTSPRGS